MPYQTLHTTESDDETLYVERFERNTKAFTAIVLLALVAAAGMAALLSFI